METIIKINLISILCFVILWLFAHYYKKHSGRKLKEEKNEI